MRPFLYALLLVLCATAAAPLAAQEAAETAASPLVAGGLLAQLFAHVESWFAGLSGQVAEAGAALSDIGRIGQWWETTWSTEAARAAGLRGALVLLAIVVLGLAAEALAARLLRHPRRLVAAHAAAQDAQAAERAAAREAEIAALVPAEAAGPASGAAEPAAVAEAEALTRVQAGMIPPQAAAAPGAAPLDPTAQAALVPAAAPASVPAGAAGAAASADTASAAAASAAAAAAAAAPATAAPAARLREAAGERLRHHRKSLHHWGLLGRMPWALADAVLSLLPLVAFLAVVSLGVALQGGEGSRFHALVMPLFSAYVGVRVALAVVRLMVSPDSAGLRLAHVADDTARYLFRQAVRIFTVAAVGIALGEVLMELGAAPHVRTLIMKATSLIVHAMLIAVVLRTRERARALIRGERPGAPLDALRGLLADVYPYAAVAVIATFWVVWALGVPNGFQRAVRFLMASTAVLAVSRIVWILIVGAIDRSFEKTDARIETVLAGNVERYHGWLRGLVNVLVAATTVIALLEVWGFDALGWFEQGTVGRRLLSAGWTIGIAAVLAIVVWESVSLALRRRIETWSASGDTLRAARLRTLVPMIRTCVLVAIALVVLFTALNELGVNVAPLLAGASILGVAIGFGSQKLVQDFITGIFLLMENAMQVGDTVTVAGVTGTVEYLSIRTVRLRAGDGSLHVIPFSAVSTVNNVNRGLGTAPVRLTLPPGSDVEAAYGVLRGVSEAMQADPRFGASMLGPVEIFGVDQIDGAGVTIAGQIKATDKGRWPVQREFNRRVLEEVRAGRLALANPRETLLAQAPGAPAASPAADGAAPAADRK